MKKIEEYLKIDSLHDENIIGMSVKKNEEFLILIKKEIIELSLVFVRPKHIRLDNFCLGNIIFGINIYESQDTTEIENDLRFVLNINKENSQNKTYFDKTKEKIIDGSLLFISIDSSYGVNGFIICESIKTHFCSMEENQL